MHAGRLDRIQLIVFAWILATICVRIRLAGYSVGFAARDAINVASFNVLIQRMNIPRFGA